MGGVGEGAVITLVERTSRFVLVAPLPITDKAIDTREQLTALITALPLQLRRSLTWDQGKEMAAHATITAALSMPVFFCEPHHRWQRGTNENTVSVMGGPVGLFSQAGVGSSR